MSRAPGHRGVLPWIAGLTLLSAGAADWPQFLGPRRDGTVAESLPKLAADPRVRWALPAGSGFAGPAVAAGKAYLHQRVDDREVLRCVEVASGKTVWEDSQPTDYADDFGFDDGPRAVPAVADGRVFTLGANGRLLSRSTRDGHTIWEFDLRKHAGASKGFFGFACSPLIQGNRLLLNVGGPAGAGVAAFAADSGKVLWQLSDDEAGYASPVAASWAGRTNSLFFTREGLVGVDAESGRQTFTYPWRAGMNASVNAASPLVLGTEVFLTASYGAGAVLLDCAGPTPRPLWSGDESLSSHYSTPVRKVDLLFGFHGRQEQRPALRCVEWKTGKVRWSEERFGAGTLAEAGGQLVILRESGELVIAPASGDKFQPGHRSQPLGRCRAAFALADGVLYARDQRQWVAVDLAAR